LRTQGNNPKLKTSENQNDDPNGRDPKYNNTALKTSQNKEVDTKSLA